MAAQVLNREMGLTHADFFRLLPQVLAGRCWRRNGATVIIIEECRQLTIQLAPEAERRMASLRLPVTRVNLAFDGYTEQDSAAFMARLERYFQRGGG
jgi:hypothetical protein